MTYRTLSSEYFAKWMCRQVLIETRQPINDPFEFRMTLKFVAADHDIYPDAIVKAYAIDAKGRTFFVNMFEGRALTVRDLEDNNFESMFEELVKSMLNSGCAVKFPSGTQIKIQFFLVGGNGVRHENALMVLDRYNLGGHVK